MSDHLHITGRQLTSARIESAGLVAIIRADSSEQLVDMCQALRDGGVRASEITMTTPGALDAIHAAVERLGSGNDGCLIGVGSVLDPETARAAILAGAQYVVTPAMNTEVIAMAHRYGRPIIPGALTPTEILSAWTAGADMVKVFPANHFGPTYIRDLLAPMPQLKLAPTGGIDLDNAEQWIKAGAVCLGVGSALVRKDLIRTRDWKGLTALARQFVEKIRQARESA